MKLATYKDGSRDGQLLVVSRDLSTAHYATGIADRLQQVLDDWNFLSPQLQDLYDTLNHGKARHAFAFEPRQCMAPLPRAYQWAVGSGYLGLLERMFRRHSTALPVDHRTDPPMYRGGSDAFLGPCDPLVCATEASGIDFGAQLAVICGDVRMGASPDQALDGIRLVMLANDFSLRLLDPEEAGVRPGRVQDKPATAFSPVAATPDELGSAWDRGRVNLTLQCAWNGRRVGLCEAGPAMTLHFGQLMAQLCRTRALQAGSVIGSGPVSDPDVRHGYGCIADKRALEAIEDGQPATGYMGWGDSIRIDMKGRDGQSVFGAIEQTIVAPA